MTSAAKAIELKKEKFADLIVILGLKYKEFICKYRKNSNVCRPSKCGTSSCRHIPFK
jgi:hypothetical protein